MKTIKQLYLVAVMAAVLGSTSPVLAAANQLQAVQASLAGGKTELSLQFNTPINTPQGFMMDNPPRLVFDFAGVDVNPVVRRNQVRAGVVRNIKAVNSKGQTRVVIELDHFAEYSVNMQSANRLLLTFNGGGNAQAETSRRFRAPDALPEVPLAVADNGYYQDASQSAQLASQQYSQDYYNQSAQQAASQQAAQQTQRQQAAQAARQQALRQQAARQQALARQRQAQYRNLPPTQSRNQFQPYAAAPQPYPVAQNGRFATTPTLRGMDFRRSPNGGARLILDLPSADTRIQEDKSGSSLTLRLDGSNIPGNLRNRLDVTDFATPVSYIQVKQEGDTGVISLNTNGTPYTYRMDRQGARVTVHIEPTRNTQATTTEIQLDGNDITNPTPATAKKKKEFNGEKLSLNFQDIEVRAVLQLLADFTDKNIVVSDSVTGNITVRLKDVPWDQALDIVLETKNLGMRENGNVIWIAPQSEMETKEEKVLQVAKRKVELEPLTTEYIPINFAKAADLANLIQKRSSDKNHSLLSDRGNVSVDDRTNTLLIQDTATRVRDIRELIKALDIPVQQVLIESRIVTATDEFGKQLGAKFGVNPQWKNKDSMGLGSGNLNATVSKANGEKIALNDLLSVNMPVTGAAGSYGFAILAKDFMLELELSALQAESKGEVIATPRVITSNQTKAVIEQGVEIPYLQDSSSGATNVAFKKAVLSLEVTPQITPDEHISMDLKVNQDTVGTVYENIPSINTREIQTRVMVSNGQTVVLGGVHEDIRLNTVNKVPVFGDLPVVGQLFRKTDNSSEKRELLIFVTPKIIDSSKTTAMSRR
ncbi:type IV pilus secretin PilQ [Thiofilum flexile]|uniref:type IV pilus secretin PilQ n=1 Tax=Thiofilum flexile TaxID=125627 RepID=UPI00036CBECB|nr:type IV pilus secretin PilQ [Thiofilum flexile]